MKISELYGLSNYVTMMEKTDLIHAKKQLKEMYLQNLLADKSNEAKPKVDPLMQAYLEGYLIEYLDQLEVMPGFEKVRDWFRPKYNRASRSQSKKNFSYNDDANSQLKRNSSQWDLSKKASLDGVLLLSAARKSKVF